MGLLNETVTNRRNQLTTALNRFGIFQSSDGRTLNELSLYELEWIHIEVINEVDREERLIAESEAQ
ncbi:Fur-regulated basic protein FbpA [Oceanobacillus caeni]|uniref:Fur-regulated basic protein FbpA n=1 Tax=Oceanobacillus caeni TaxID=405946 RepID=UPI002149EAC7|nr:Fur-regulated basic protein FbpA [Oceanobacillus caeni]MCR1833077.1 Fur-regulated basic protein FbpA [Oceanobacillus caeni]